MQKRTDGKRNGSSFDGYHLSSVMRKRERESEGGRLLTIDVNFASRVTRVQHVIIESRMTMNLDVCTRCIRVEFMNQFPNKSITIGSRICVTANRI